MTQEKLIEQIKTDINNLIKVIYTENNSNNDDALKLLNIAFLHGKINGLLDVLSHIDDTYKSFVSAYSTIETETAVILSMTDKLYRKLQEV